jgi:cytochrome c oxidase assembly factor CtaG
MWDQDIATVRFIVSNNALYVLPVFHVTSHFFHIISQFDFFFSSQTFLSLIKFKEKFSNI